ncbi:39S ribosomal protein L49, mitochondrial isoform X2 [Aplysia californica]|uniref:Large ribosomal subunit protein mL49 n=1 Tax=Aplysia californica TaxID=6500 RepID=A0ABM0K972_APLCA|nr:39S ribosomal protein L49, mitochondrial isoform X2 [Aplysia californica]
MVTSDMRFQSSSAGGSHVEAEMPTQFEVSYEDFKHVEPLLPSSVVPPVPEHEMYPTSSGWFPPNDELRSQQKYTVLRTKNHMLPVYAKVQHRERRTQHLVTIKRIEGDIWALEAELRDFLEKETGGEIIRTQVHEVARLIRVRGLYAPLIADFLLKRGM